MLFCRNFEIQIKFQTLKIMNKKPRSKYLGKPNHYDLIAMLGSTQNPEDYHHDILLVSNQDTLNDGYLHLNKNQIQQAYMSPQTHNKKINTQPFKKDKETKRERHPVTEPYPQYSKPRNKSLQSQHDHRYALLRGHINPASFLLFNDDHYNNIQVLHRQPLEQRINTNDRLAAKMRQSKTYSTFMKKRNKSMGQQQEKLTENKDIPINTNSKVPPPPLLYYLTKSCQLKRKEIDEPYNLTKNTATSKLTQQNGLDVQCPSPTFQNKKIAIRQVWYGRSKETPKKTNI